jgi:hypothetical protein
MVRGDLTLTLPNPVFDATHIAGDSPAEVYDIEGTADGAAAAWVRG